MKAVKTVSHQHIVSPCFAAARCCAGLAHAIARSRVAWLVLAVLGLLWPGVASASASDLPANGSTNQPIPWAEVGARATAQYSGDGLAVTPTADGTVRLRCTFQKLEGEATREGLWLTSTADPAAADRFRLVAAAVGRAGGQVAALPPQGTASGEGARARFTRPGLVEEYSVSVDGVRQDFVVAAPPAGAGDLRVELALSGARAAKAAQGARLVLDGSGRELAYHRMRVVDAQDRELTARLEVMGEHRLAVVVADAGAAYPVRIDPTFSGAQWTSMGTVVGADSMVYCYTEDTNGNLYMGGSFSVIGTNIVLSIAKWDGTRWSALGTGLSGTVYAMPLSAPTFTPAALSIGRLRPPELEMALFWARSASGTAPPGQPSAAG